MPRRKKIPEIPTNKILVLMDLPKWYCTYIYDYETKGKKKSEYNMQDVIEYYDDFWFEYDDFFCFYLTQQQESFLKKHKNVPKYALYGEQDGDIILLGIDTNLDKLYRLWEKSKDVESPFYTTIEVAGQEMEYEYDDEEDDEDDTDDEDEEYYE